MKLPISWLNDFIETEASVDDICNALTGIGFEVEEVIKYGINISNVVVGKIIELMPHPDADKLKVCKVDIGNEVLTVITGADNVKVNDIVPVAKDGAVLPNGKTIKAAPLRGIMSYGMLCSGGELNINDAFVSGASVNGILILDGDLKIGEDIIKALKLDETVLDISITANRSDCHSIFGLAREIATSLKLNIKEPNFEFTLAANSEKIPSVKISTSECPVYSRSMISDIKIEESPKWMQRRLFMCDINPINNVVDITNYVLLEIGQPLHAFDRKIINGNIIVRNASVGEKITALNGEEYALSPYMTLICDEEKPLAIAGVMGGKFSGITNDTKTVFLESARFNRGNIRNTSLKLGLRSDSSKKFERGVDYYSVEFGRRRALALFEQLGVGKVVYDCPIDERPIKSIKTSTSQINALLGIVIPKKDIISILETLGMKVEVDKNELNVSIPAYREDIDNYTDLAEEVIRFYGYDKMNETFMPTSSVTIGGLTYRQKHIEDIKDMLCAYGAYEIMTYSFTDEKVYDKLCLLENDRRRSAIKIRNPISEDLSIMKTELVSGMLSVIATNLTRRNDNFRLFELAKVYEAELPVKDLPNERDTLCVSLVGGKEDFYEIKSIFTGILDNFKIAYTIKSSNEPYLHPGISADLYVGDKLIASFGKLHPSVCKNFGIKKSDIFIGQMHCEIITEQKETVVKYKPLPKFPSVERDLAIIVNESITIGDIVDAIKKSDKIIENVELFDIYRGEQIEKGYKSVALKIKLVPVDKTLIDSEIADIMGKVLSALKNKFDARVRE